MEPLCFAILKSLTPDNVETSFYDERLEPIPIDAETDLVAMTVETYTARRAYQIAAQYRELGIPVVFGGYHPTFLPDEALQHADAVVQGDAEGVWGQILEDALFGEGLSECRIPGPCERHSGQIDFQRKKIRPNGFGPIRPGLQI
jgi:radical SAM superfamily enzyme YgiQ (UPF0313 family)